MNIENSFWFRHFLMCSQMGNILLTSRGLEKENFANLIIEVEHGKYANEQMTVYFYLSDKFLSQLHCSDEDEVFNSLAENGISMEELAKLSVE